MAGVLHSWDPPPAANGRPRESVAVLDTCAKCEDCVLQPRDARKLARVWGRRRLSIPRSSVCPFRRLSDVHWKDFLPGAKSVERKRETPPTTAGFLLEED